MATNLLMPKWGMSMEEGKVNSWLKKEGDPVSQGEGIVEVESSKATAVVEAPASGILARILVQEGQTVPITTAIAVIKDIGEAAPADGAVSAAHPQKAPRAASTPSVKDSTAAPSQTPARDRSRVAASPAARRLARERSFDLASVKGTGLDGMIVVEDVEAALKAPPRPAASPISKVAFYSQGHKLDGILYLPKDYQAGQRLPGIVFCLGFTYIKDLLVPEMARRLSAKGYACLLFDYRGFGASEGPRGRLLPLEQVADVQAAVTFLASRTELDASRIALAGISLGGSHALQAAAWNQRVRAVAAISPVGDGRRWLRGSRRYWEWIALLAKIDADRTARVLGGAGERVDAWEIVAPDPDSRKFLDGVLREFPAMKCTLPLETAEALIEYCPESVVGRIAPRPILLIHGENDLLVPADESHHLFVEAGNPRELAIVPGMGHFDWAAPPNKGFDHVMEKLGRWLGEHLSAGK